MIDWLLYAYEHTRSKYDEQTNQVTHHDACVRVYI